MCEKRTYAKPGHQQQRSNSVFYPHHHPTLTDLTDVDAFCPKSIDPRPFSDMADPASVISKFDQIALKFNQIPPKSLDAFNNPTNNTNKNQVTTVQPQSHQTSNDHHQYHSSYSSPHSYQFSNFHVQQQNRNQHHHQNSTSSSSSPSSSGKFKDNYHCFWKIHTDVSALYFSNLHFKCNNFKHFSNRFYFSKCIDILKYVSFLIFYIFKILVIRIYQRPGAMSKDASKTMKLYNFF